MMQLVIIAFVSTVAVIDVSTHKIPRELTTSAFLVGIFFHALKGGFLGALGASATAFVVGMILFRMGAIGGGDVKLLTALGALLGWSLWVHAMYITVMAAAVIAVLVAIYRGALLSTLRNSVALVTSLPTRGLDPHPEINVRNQSSVRTPFGLAAAIGTIVILLRP